MPKRKSIVGSNASKGVSDDSGNEEDFDTLNVEFEWFDPQPAYDFHGIKTLLQQLFDVDAQLFDLSALTDLILAQPLLGSTVKVEGNETDPYAFLSVINLREHYSKPVVSKLVEYLRRKAASSSSHTAVAKLLSPSDLPSIGLILTERLINVPSEVTPPMYSMLLEEIQWAVEEKEPYTFSHYLIVSKTYTEVVSKLENEDERPKKKKKKGGESTAAGVFYFHPEDEIFERHALSHGPYDYTTKQAEGHSDSKRAFQEMGIKPLGHMMLIEAGMLEQAVKDVEEYLKPRG